MALVAGRNFRTHKGIGIIEPFAFLSAHERPFGDRHRNSTPVKIPLLGSFSVWYHVFAHDQTLEKRVFNSDS